jgi:hypothetical protein
LSGCRRAFFSRCRFLSRRIPRRHRARIYGPLKRISFLYCFQEICERAWFKHRWHFEFHESDEGTKYILLLKCFGEVLGKKQSDIAAMDFPADGEDTPKRKEKRKKSSASSKEHTHGIDEPSLTKRKSRRASKLLEDGKLLENVKDKRSSRKSVRETVIPATSDTMRARQLRRKESNLSNSSSSRT